MADFQFTAGDTPVLMSIPHLSERLPPDLASRMTEAGLAVGDTDWALDRLYDFARDLGLSIITPAYSRYVADLNRHPDGAPLYPGAANTGLVPLQSFLGQPLYLPGREPDGAENAARRDRYWRPYHARLGQALDDLVNRFGKAVLFDCHSIRSRVPLFFEGVLPDFNLGTADGESCAPGLRDTLASALGDGAGYSLAVDGRFKGGYITRHYGRPADGVHAFQLELSMATYMDEDPALRWNHDLAEKVKPRLRAMVEAALAWATGAG
jgi:N-formylglutamate deformylase